MKRYTLVFIFTKDMDKVLLVRRFLKPYQFKLNGIGGKIEEGETIIEGSIREIKEEVGLDITDVKHFMKLEYIDPYVELNILYASIENVVKIQDNLEGSYDFYDVNYAMDFENKEFAGYANITVFIREILIKENRLTFYND
jgi:8-oxo-dGTP pyrophosphatase MutT (NUDIX family)